MNYEAVERTLTRVKLIHLPFTTPFRWLTISLFASYIGGSVWTAFRVRDSFIHSGLRVGIRYRVRISCRSHLDKTCVHKGRVLNACGIWVGRSAYRKIYHKSIPCTWNNLVDVASFKRLGFCAWRFHGLLKVLNHQSPRQVLATLQQANNPFSKTV